MEPEPNRNNSYFPKNPRYLGDRQSEHQGSVSRNQPGINYNFLFSPYSTMGMSGMGIPNNYSYAMGQYASNPFMYDHMNQGRDYNSSMPYPMNATFRIQGIQHVQDPRVNGRETFPKKSP